MSPQLVTFSIIFITLINYIASADVSDVESKLAQAKQEEDEALSKLQESMLETIDNISRYTDEVIQLVQGSIEKSIENAKEEMDIMLRDAANIMSKINKIKKKAKENINECNARFLGESGVLKHLLELKEEIEFAVKEVKECPMNIGGMECLINTLIRGEALLNDADGIIEAEKGTPLERAENLIQWIDKCIRKVIQTITTLTVDFSKDTGVCI